LPTGVRTDRRTEEGAFSLAPRTLRGLRRIAIAVAATAVAMTVSAILAPTPAHADPSPATLAQQVEEQGRALGVVMEQYNTVNVQLTRTQAELADVAARIPRLTAQLDQQAAAVDALATSAYEGSTVSGIDALLSAGSPADLIDRMNTLGALARGRQRDILALTQAREALQAQQAKLDGLVAQQTAQQNDLASRKTKIEAQIVALKKQQDELARRQAEQARIAAAQAAAAHRAAPPPPPSGGTPPPPPPYVPGRAGKVVAYAYAQLGKPYVFGAAGPRAFDCSGLVMMAWAQVGVQLEHSSYIQMREQTVHIARSQLQPGDIVFFYGGGHEGLYIGNGNVIHAPHTGDVVKISSLSWMGNYTVAGRPR
jgi:cell wall-associated NlpC family hydrolase